MRIANDVYMYAKCLARDAISQIKIKNCPRSVHLRYSLGYVLVATASSCALLLYASCLVVINLF